MLTDSTASKIDQGLSRLRAAQAEGSATPAGQITIEEIATWCGVSRRTIRELESLALAKVFQRLKAAGLPPHLAGKPSRYDLP
jgi:DNA-directed RNA polymerase sigma subunit (sigma70/sigma32)